MELLWSVIYNVFVMAPLYGALRVAGLFNRKIRGGIRGRKGLFTRLAASVAKLPKGRKNIWVHSSSMGEFEQAKPIIERLRDEKKVNIIVTFFSPSGYDNSKKYPYADIITYIPFDTPGNARKFIDLVKPSLTILMRYDIWPNHIWQLANRKVPVLLVDATMRSNSGRKNPVARSFHRSLYEKVSGILTVSASDAEGFESFGLRNGKVTVVGDTRFDRVFQKSSAAKERQLLRDDIRKGKKLIVAGSTWGEDEDVLLPAFHTLLKYDPNVLIIIVPHEPTVLHLEKLEHEFLGKEKTIRFSFLNAWHGERVILVDSIGILLTLYYYADIAFVGGSFKSSIHNVLEAAVYGIPVLYGPKIHSSHEAEELARLGGGVVLRGKKDAYRVMRHLLQNDLLRQQKGMVCRDYVNQNTGATAKIVSEVAKFIN